MFRVNKSRFFIGDFHDTYWHILDWPTTSDIKKKMPRHYQCFKDICPAKAMVSREGALNLARYFPKYFCVGIAIFIRTNQKTHKLGMAGLGSQFDS